MQELELNYPTTKGKIYSEEEDRYLLCRLNHYGLKTEDVYERIKKDITEFPVFRFDWFFKSRTPQELQRRCNERLVQRWMKKILFWWKVLDIGFSRNSRRKSWHI